MLCYSCNEVEGGEAAGHIPKNSPSHDEFMFPKQVQ